MKTKKEMNDLMQYMLHKNYKELCDQIKIQILEKLIELSLKKPQGSECITFFELEAIKQGVDELRSKEKAKELKSLASVIDNLVSRGNGKVPVNEVD